MNHASLPLCFVMLAACMSSPGDSCPADQPDSCPATMPSYATDVQPIIENLCVTCHSPSGEEPSRPLQTYGEVFALRGSILGQVNNCIMPLGSATQPTDAQRVALLTWLVCGAPNN